MKKMFLGLIFVVTLLGFVVYNVGSEIGAYEDPAGIVKKAKSDEPESICPKTLMTNKCLSCHLAPDFSLRTLTLEEQYNNDGGTYPSNFRMIREGKKEFGYFLSHIISAAEYEAVFSWMSKRPHINYLVIEIYSPGGSMFQAKRIITLMDEFKARGNIIETRVRAGAASAGFLVLLNGTKGFRYIHPQAEVMWHELRTMEGWFLKLVSPADKEEEARIMRHWQDTQDKWVSEKSKLSQAKVTELIRFKELWCNGREAVEKYGFADKLIE